MITYKNSLLSALFSVATLTQVMASADLSLTPQQERATETHREPVPGTLCKAVHFYQVEDPKNKSVLFLLGSNHAVHLKKIPGEVVDKMSTASCLVTEIDGSEMTPEQFEKMQKESDLKILEFCIHQLKEKGLYRDQQHLGFMDKHASNPISAVLHRKKIATAKAWFDLIKGDLPDSTLQTIHTQAKELGFSDADDMLQHFHPLVLPLLVKLSHEGEYFEECAEGIDILLEKHFKHELKKPIIALEDEFDRAKAVFETEIKPSLEELPSNGKFSLSDLDQIKEVLSAIDESAIDEGMNEEAIKLKSLKTYIEEYDDLRKKGLEASIKSSELLINLTFNRHKLNNEQIKIYHLNVQRFELYNNPADKEKIAKIKLSIEKLEVENEKIIVELEKYKAEQEKSRKELENFIPTGAYDTEYLSGDISAKLKEQGNDPHTTLVARNKNWLPKIKDLLKTENGIVSCVVGAAHLYGKHGLLNLLSDYKVSRWSLESHSFESEK